jgi:diadenosine tetraphosphatase ApaH/serine/threonine PP2A family protein phosphatase
MRKLIISDIHANITALEAVLEDAAPFDQVWCLGDVVGYGPDPNQCIERLQSLSDLMCIKGNHDAAILGEINIRAFNSEARKSLRWLEDVLEDANRAWLQALKEKMVVEGITLAHGSPRNPIWEYVMDLEAARENFAHFEATVCLVGHTHIPSLYQKQGDSLESVSLFFPEINLGFPIHQKSILNPGSVGQPRDHDPRASYIIYESEENLWTFHRVVYDVLSVQKRILAAGLPNRHAFRLEEGW